MGHGRLQPWCAAHGRCEVSAVDGLSAAIESLEVVEAREPGYPGMRDLLAIAYAVRELQQSAQRITRAENFRLGLRLDESDSRARLECQIERAIQLQFTSNGRSSTEDDAQVEVAISDSFERDVVHAVLADYRAAGWRTVLRQELGVPGSTVTLTAVKR